MTQFRSSASKNTKHPHASAVQIFKERRPLPSGRFRRRAHYTDRSPWVNPFRYPAASVAPDDFSSADHDSTTRANFRFPTWITKGPPADNLRVLSLTFAPSSLTPPCSIMRIASDVLDVSPDCLRTW